MDFILFVLIVGSCFGAFIYYINNPISSKNPKTNEQPKKETQKIEIVDIEILAAAEQFKDDIANFEKQYIAHSDFLNLKNIYEDISTKINKLSKNTIMSYDSLVYFEMLYSNLEQWITDHNQSFIANELIEAKPLLSNIDGKALDNQQSVAVVTNEDNTLVVAGAGSGKTLTISGKVKYLVNRLNVNPKDILLISFTAKSAAEMTKRIENKLNLPIDAMTFHKLGLEIIKQDEKQQPDISDTLSDYINTYFNSHTLKNPTSMERIIRFYATYLAVPKDIEKFETFGEYNEDQSSYDMETLKSKVETSSEELKASRKTLKLEQVKSLEEVMIANYLYLHGVNYEYEALYPFETDQFRKRYRPDFFLPDYNVYLEHFGVNKHNRAPWLSKIEEQKYIEGMQWKRELHRKNKTTLIETYSHYVPSGVLFEKLEAMLRKLNIPLKEADYVGIYMKLIIDQKQNQQFKEFKNLISTFITLFKSNGYDDDEFDRLEASAKQEKSEFLRERTLLFLKIVRPIYQGYQEELLKNHAIDFNDMINKATTIVKHKKPPFINYKYIIIDEFQDISIGRFRLVKAIKELTNAKILAVGDDWQAIYRFAGSDLNIFTKFEKFFGYSKQLRIERTYRNSQQLIDIASKFVMKNPIQLKKQLRSDKRLEQPLKIYGYVDDVVNSFTAAVDDILAKMGEAADIMVVGRNNMDLKFMLDRDTLGRFKISENSKGVFITDKRYPNSKIQYITVHRSKGLEADNVIVINLRNHIVGFPNKISDDPLLSMVLTDEDQFMYAEERRLFYVAITRTKNRTYLLAPEKDTSIFVEELIKEQNIPFEVVTNEQSVRTNPNCDVCQTGVLVIRQSGDGRSFLGCSNYPGCNKTYKEIDILKNPIRCTKCGGYMLKRKGPRGVFYGCSNYPICRNSMDIRMTAKSVPF